MESRRHPVTCPVTGPTVGSGFLSVDPQIEQYFPPDDFTDYWEAPAGHPSRFAVSVFNADPTGNPLLFVGVEDASCAAPPTTVFYDGGSLQPRFNTDGSRLVFMGDGDMNIVTVSPDGSNMRVVANYGSGLVDSGLQSDTNSLGLTFPPRPQWQGTQVAWVRQYNNSPSPPAWEIVTANDVAGATPTRYMACPGGTPREFQFLADGSVIVAYRTTASTGPENLYHLAPDGSQNCTILQQYTDLGNSAVSQATGFAVSPDGTQIAFLRLDALVDDAGFTTTGGLPGGYPYVVAVDGGTPTRLSEDFFMYGPRWVGDGTRLLATRIDGYTDGGFVAAATSIIVRPPTGGVAGGAVLRADGYSTFATTGSNGGCNAAAGAAPPIAALFGLLGAAFARSIRRRRRSR